jgi:hypothetical protein
MIEAGRRPMTDDSIRLGYILVFAAAAVLYAATCAPGPVWQDSGLIQYRVWHNDIEGKLGLALSHPLFYIIAIAAKHVPLGQFAYRVNLTNAIISALAVANLFLLLSLWLSSAPTKGPWALPAVVGALSLALSHTFWWHAAVPETYNLGMALLLFELIILLRYAGTGRVTWLYSLAFVNGLAMANHMLASIPLACYLALFLALAARKQIRSKHVLVMALLWIIGALPYEYLIIREIVRSGDFWATMSSAAFGKSYKADVLNTSLSGKIVKENLMWMALNFPTPNIILAFVGISVLHRASPKRWFARIILALLVLFLIFAFRYTIVDRYAFFIPFYCIVSILIAVGACSVLARRRRKTLGRVIVALCFLTIPAYIAAPKAAKWLGISSGRERNIPYRDDHSYFLRPWKTGCRGAERFADEALDAVRQDAIVYADNTTSAPLLYAQEVKAKRPDVKIISPVACSPGSPELNEQTIDGLLAEQRIYVVSPVKNYCPDLLLERCVFEPAGPIYHALPKRAE